MQQATWHFGRGSSSGAESTRSADSATAVQAVAGTAEVADVELDEVQPAFDRLEPAIGRLQQQTESMRVAAGRETGGVASGRVHDLHLLERGPRFAADEQQGDGGGSEQSQGHGAAIEAGVGRGGTGCGSTAVPI